MTPFSIAGPARILFGRDEAAKAPALIRAFGPRGMVVHGSDPRRIAPLLAALAAQGCVTATLACPCEPTLPLLQDALAKGRAHAPDWVLGIGGGSAIDLAKALAALIPATGDPMDHLEVVGRALPLATPPLPFIAMPTTAGTGAEATKNAVIGLPDTMVGGGRKVSLRDDTMFARLAIIDPALTDGCPRAVTLASGLDAITQVIEPYISSKATPYTDAITRPAIATGLVALKRLMQAEDPAARDALAWTSLTGGIALANAGLGVVHGLAGVIGGLTPAAHGAICGVLLGPSLAMNRTRCTGTALTRITEVCTTIADTLGGTATDAPETLSRWAAAQGLHPLTAQGLPATLHEQVATAAQSSSSMKGNPVPLALEDLRQILAAAG